MLKTCAKKLQKVTIINTSSGLVRWTNFRVNKYKKIVKIFWEVSIIGKKGIFFSIRAIAQPSYLFVNKIL